ALDARISELEQQHRDTWAGPFAVAPREATFRRGLLAADCPARNFPLRAMTTLARTELACWLDRLTLRRFTAKDRPRIARCPLLAAVPALRIQGSRSQPSGLAALLESPHLGRLRALDLSEYGALSGANFSVVTQADLPALNEIHLSLVGFGDDNAAALTGTAWFERLQTLDLMNCRVPVAALGLLFASGRPRLRDLHLASNRLC